jgi:hypothetical protein
MSEIKSSKEKAMEIADGLTASSTSTGTERRDSHILLKMARPDIYRINAFRILELPITASAREISSKLRRLELEEKLGSGMQRERGILSIVPPPDNYARREATQRLSDPESRLIDELFWFWPTHVGASDKDEAFVALERNDILNAETIWKRREAEGSEANVSMHNLAILYHALALDLEHIETTQPLSKEQSGQKRDYWGQVYARWRILLSYDGFWQRVKDRAHELDDPRLTTGTIRRIREGLPFVLLSINAALAARAAQKNNHGGIWSHVDLMRQSGFDATEINKATDHAVSPISNRVKIICANAQDETKKAPEHADQCALRVINETSNLLSTLDKLLPKGHPVREVAHDEVASRVLQTQISFGNATENWSRSLELLDEALQIAASASLRKRIEDNIRIVSGNKEYDTCWFCKECSADDKAKVEVKMYGEVTHTPAWNGTHVQWRQRTVTVPRCKRCKSAHGHYNTSIGLGWTLGVLIGFGGCIPVASSNGFLGFLTFCTCMGIGAGIGHGISKRILSRGVRKEGTKSEFPAIKNLLSEGWAFGEKPPGVQ